MSMIDQARSYLGQKFIGTNDSDKGQCVGLFNKVVQDVTGVLYPIQGAQLAAQILTASNTRPDLCQQVRNNPNDPNQLPSVGDAMIWNTNIGGGAGHVAFYESGNANSFTSIDENWVANTVTQQVHNWTNIIGWIHFNVNNPAPAPAPSTVTIQIAEYNDLKNWKQHAVDLQANVDTLNGSIASLQATIDQLSAGASKDELNKLIDSLKAQLAQVQAEYEAEKAKPPVIQTIEVVKPNRWSWLTDLLDKFLKRSK